MEQLILRSMIEFGEVDEFLADVSIECFSKEARELLEIISVLNEKKILNLDTFLGKLTLEQAKSDYVVDLVAQNPKVNYLNLKGEFLHSYELNRQREIAIKMLRASDEKILLDVDVLDKPAQAVKYRNFAEWKEFYETKLESFSYKTGINFLDSALNGGIEESQLILISGDPEAGKTSLGVQILENIAKKHKVCLFSFEFTIQQYLKSPKPAGFNPQNMIIINDGYELYNVIQNIKNLYRAGVRVFLIDSQMRVVSSQGRNMEEEESLKFSSLARLCHSLGIIVMMIVQTSKGDRDNPMGSKKGGHEASIIIRLEHEKAKNDMREFDEESRIVILKKNKQTGIHYKERVNFNAKSRTFSAYTSDTPKTQEIDYKKVVEVINI